MEIYILRHGIAEDARPGASDAQRALTKEGREKLETTLKRAAAAGVQPTLILTSPLVRAEQTALIAAKILNYGASPVQTETLVPGGSPEGVWDEIRGHRTEAQLMLAGHEPLLSHLVGYLLGAPALQVDLKKGSIVRIDMDAFRGEPRGVLRWMLTPKLAG